jgi:hypothetical protein
MSETNESNETNENNKNIDSNKKAGALLALIAYGAQDKYMHESDDLLYNAKNKFITEKYQVVYHEIECDVSVNPHHRNIVKFVVKLQCDMINMLDLVVPNKDGKSLNTIIKSIECTLGGQRMDKICTVDIETHVKTNCALFGRKMTTINGKTYVPLTIAPLHVHNLCPLLALSIHDLVITIELHHNITDDNIDYALYGNNYFLATPDRRRLVEGNQAGTQRFITVQNQHHGEKTMRKGINIFDLNYNHPVYMIYFWGFDKTKVTNVKLTLNGGSFYDGPIGPL